jgi:hypothetical protein
LRKRASRVSPVRIILNQTKRIVQLATRWRPRRGGKAQPRYPQYQAAILAEAV